MRGILHIVNGYCGNKVYDYLISVLDSLGIKQWVFVPARKKEQRDCYSIAGLSHTEYTYGQIPGGVFSRIFFFRKLRTISREIERSENFSKRMLVHAHSLFSDGGVALRLSRKFNMEYLVAIRNTDVNFYFRYFLFMRGLGNKILAGSKMVIFISPAYQDFVLRKYINADHRDQIRRKSLIVPNPIDSFWMDHIFSRNSGPTDPIILLYVGEIRKNKNIHSTIRAVELLRSRGLNVHFQVIGFGLNDEQSYAKKIRKLSAASSSVEAIEAITNKEDLIEYYRNADIFVMPSLKETFGLVYAEAMSQGLPVIWSKGQGIDGYFHEGEIGHSADPQDPETIVEAIRNILLQYQKISTFCSAHASLFSRDRIGKIYQTLYET